MTPDSVQDRADAAPSPLADEFDVPYTYDASLTIKHPALQPARITEALGVTPECSWMAGEPRRTPAGTTLPGVRAESYWFAKSRVQGFRAFFEGVSTWLDLLERHGAFIREISRTGGSVGLNVALNGEHNIGDVMQASTLGRMAALNVHLGLEVFPVVQN